MSKKSKARYKKQNILITGGCGFVGRHLSSYFLYKGSAVTVVDDLSFGIHPSKWVPFLLNKTQFTFYHQNVLHYFLNETEKPKFDIIIHLAAIVGGRVMIEQNPLQVGVDIAIDSLFFNWLVNLPYKPERVIYASSSSVYPINLQTKKIKRALREKDIDFAKYTIGKPDSTYGWSKLTGEYLAYIAWEKYKQNVIIIRPFSGYGEDQDMSYPVPSLMSQIARKENPVKVWGTGNQGRDFVHVSDCIFALEILLSQDTKKLIISNVGSGKLTTFKRLIRLGAKIREYNPEIQPLLDKPVGVQSRYSSIQNSPLFKLSWRPKISLKEGIRRMINYYKEKKMNLPQLYESYYR